MIQKFFVKLSYICANACMQEDVKRNIKWLILQQIF